MSTPKTWLVTGGSRGIGRAVVEHATARGDRVAVFARKPAGEQWHLPDRVVEISTDITDPASLRRGVDAVFERFGSLDVVVNAAGVHRGGRIGDLSREHWDEVIATNLTGAFELARTVVPRLQAGASMINVGAVVGFRGFPGDVAYGAAKAGLSGLTQVLAVELAPRDIRVNLVIPGFVDTDMTSTLTGRARDKVIASIPMGRTGRPEEIAQVIVGVADSPYMTGSVVATDGGLMSSFSSRD
ncbi:SDR family NAD(P)-dependent oxidoreductase [Rhodococcus chondri]|uniref:SDR family NAD(P)-dependent oxidoreductase n=1 Tax=Rhodococcus chondri TaxID=3065941 RepID=A0ABU7JS61_9NOCA|nr:SDR family NAD(P)-dependent oxidoreductase [Rhodococcus sp. CC-R104]MEE2032665.1 SDR family NAD(P)-dependent oxidoreductase [Rhodococcus sp. CC-R104]